MKNNSQFLPSLNSLKKDNIISYCRGISAQEKALLNLLISKFRFVGGTYDLFDQKTWSNKCLGVALNCSAETAAKIKEQLHARGVILIDNERWEDYRVTVGCSVVRFKSAYSHTITLSNEFIEWLQESCQNKVNAPWKFDLHKEYVKKYEAKKARNREAVSRFWAKKLGINLLKSCENVSNKSIPSGQNEVSINSRQIYIYDKEKRLYKDKDPRPDYDFQKNSNFSVKILSNSDITKKMTYRKTCTKKWTDSTKKMAMSLIDSGMRLKDVAKVFIEQRYTANMTDFMEKMEFRQAET